MKKYYIVVEGSQAGPFSIEELNDKKISKSTLVWNETMEDWTEASKVDELKELIKKTPPPIPNEKDKHLKVEAEISKKKEKIITSNTEVAVAKETKTVFKKIIYGLILGVLSFPIFYYGIYQANKYDNFNVYERVAFDGSFTSGINVTDFPFPFFGGEYSAVQQNIERRKEIYTEKSMYSALITFLIVSGVLVVYRYVSKGAKWVLESSNK